MSDQNSLAVITIEEFHRELENLLKRAHVLSRKDLISELDKVNFISEVIGEDASELSYCKYCLQHGTAIFEAVSELDHRVTCKACGGGTGAFASPKMAKNEWNGIQ